MSRLHQPSDGSIAEVTTERMATGGEAVARLDDGRVVFVAGALAGEQVRISIDVEKKRFARAHAIEIVEASPDRRVPGCRHFVDGECGGCDWMHVERAKQRDYKAGIALEQLQRLGGIDNPKVAHRDHPPGLRTTVRCVVTDGRAGYRARGSHTGFNASVCDAAHDSLRELIVDGHYGAASQVTLRTSATTGERLVVVDGASDLAAIRVPDDVVVVGKDSPGDAGITETIAGVSFRVSAQSFFQTSPEGAEALVAAVAHALDGVGGPIVDLYGGVGLLGGAATPGRLATVVESSPSSVGDAKFNLGADVTVIEQRVEQWQPDTRYAAVIADPARSGLRADGAQVVAATQAQELVLVSCDAAALGRDAGLLVADGWHHRGSVVIDMFPDTSQLEVVSHFRRG